MSNAIINVSNIEYVEYNQNVKGFQIKIFMVSGRVVEKQFTTEPEADNFYSNLQSLIGNYVEFNRQ